MSRKIEHQIMTDLYLKWFGIHVIPHFIERWANLPESTHNIEEKTILAGLTHEDLSDGIYLRSVINKIDPTIEYHGVVFAEGLEDEQGKPNLRAKIANRILPLILWHKYNPRPSELKHVSEAAQKAAIAIYIQGTRNPNAPLQETLTPIVGRGKRKKPTQIFPFVSLGLKGGIFPTNSTQKDNIKALFTQSALANALTGKKREIHFVAGEPLDYAPEVRELEHIRLVLLNELFNKAPNLIETYKQTYQEEYDYCVLGLKRRNI
jgi:hypothetical protein